MCVTFQGYMHLAQWISHYSIKHEAKTAPLPTQLLVSAPTFLRAEILVCRSFQSTTFLLAPSRLRVAILPVHAVWYSWQPVSSHSCETQRSSKYQGKGLPLQWSEHSFIITRWARYSHRKKSQDVDVQLCLTLVDSQCCSICSEPAKAGSFKNEVWAPFPPYKVLGEVTVTYFGKEVLEKLD